TGARRRATASSPTSATRPSRRRRCRRRSRSRSSRAACSRRPPAHWPPRAAASATTMRTRRSPTARACRRRFRTAGGSSSARGRWSACAPSRTRARSSECAPQRADEALKAVLEAGIVGRSEREVAIELELRMRRLGAEAPSFSSIVASGAHGALPHAEPRAQQIPRDVLVTIDWGARLEGYCSDCTRTYATGEGISARAREVYELVLAAQEAGVAALETGPTGREVDAVARAVVERAGEGEHFGHGLGHGVGLDVHEAPRLSRIESEQALQAGNVVTVEPGVYLPQELGVRIEDLLVVREGGREALNGLEKALTVVS